MIAPEYFNNHIAVEGEIVVKRVPNDTGSVLVWNSTTKKISTRTVSEIVSDLSLMTTNTSQDVIGRKWFFTTGGSNWNNSTLGIMSQDGSNPTIAFYKGGTNIAGLNYDGGTFHFNNNGNVTDYSMIRVAGIYKNGSDDNHILLGGGGHKSVSDFALNSSLNNYWEKYTVAGYKGVNAPTPFSFLNEGEAQEAYMGGLLVSNAFQDEGLIPANGIYSKGNVISGANFTGRGLYSPVLDGGQVIYAGHTDTLYFGNPSVAALYLESGNNNLLHNRAGIGVGVIWDAHNFNPDNKISTTHPAYGITQNYLDGWFTYKGYGDVRFLRPSNIEPQKLQFGFTSWDNNDNSPFADFLHFGGYPDSSGGNQNLIVFKKNGFGLRQWQETSQSPVPYQSFVDYWHTGNFNAYNQIPNRLGLVDYNSYAFIPFAKTQNNTPFKEDPSLVIGTFYANRSAGNDKIEGIGVGNNFEEFEVTFKNGLWAGSQTENWYNCSIIYKHGTKQTTNAPKLATAKINGVEYIGLKVFPDIDKNYFFKGYATKKDTLVPHVYFSVDTGTVNLEIESTIQEVPFNANNASPYWNNKRLATTEDLSSNLNDVVFLSTPQTFIANKNFAQTADVRFYGNESNEVRVWRDSNGAGYGGIVSGHILNWYGSRWKVGHQRGYGSESGGYGFWLSTDDGATFERRVEIRTDGVISTHLTGNSLQWDSAYHWGNHANVGYSTQTWVSNNFIPISEKGQANGVATLDNGGKVPESQLPSYVDDVLEFSSLSNFPTIGETGKIYVSIDTNLTYRWSGSTYIQIASGAVQSVNGQTGIVNLTKSDIGLGNVDNTVDAIKNVATAGSLRNVNISLAQLNSLTLEPGIYNAENYVPGDGLTANFHYIIQLGSYSNGGYRSQIAIPYAGGTNDSMYIRVATNSWGTWERIAKNSDITAAINALNLSNYATISQLNEKVSRSGDTMTGMINFANNVGGIMGNIGDNDYWRVYGNTVGSNQGYLEIATGDDGNEPIYVRQYSGVFANIVRTATILDESGNTHFPNTVYSGNGNSSEWQSAYHWGNHKAVGNNQYLGSDYVGGGSEKPNSSYFGAGKLKLQMLNGGNVGAPDIWNDVLWMSSYTGGDVKMSTAIVSSKYSNEIGFVKQDYDATNWGTYIKFWTSDNLKKSDFVKSTVTENYDTNANYETSFSHAYVNMPSFFPVDQSGTLLHKQYNDNFATQFALSYYGGLGYRHKQYGSWSSWYKVYTSLDFASSGNWNDNSIITDRKVIGELAWKNYGNGHTIFDISNGITPWGVSKSNIDSEQPWSPSYPTLVGGNGAGTYGVRVDSARIADDSKKLDGLTADNFLNNLYLSNKTSLSNDAITSGIMINYLPSSDPNKPAGMIDGSLLTLNYNSIWSTQLLGDWRTNDLYFRTQQSGTWKTFAKIWHSDNFNPASYVTQSSLNSQLGSYATLNGVQTFTNTNTFSQSPVIPNGTLGTHAINKNQIELSTLPENEGGQQLNISGNNSVNLTNYFVTSRDGSRNPDDIVPNSTPRRVRFDFANSTSAGLGGSGNYAGVMTYSPWDGTKDSTGDSSYQLAFANQTGSNGSGIPMLKIRKGIDGRWGKSWYKFWTDADFTNTNIQQWNHAYQYGLRLNEEFTTNLNTGLMLADDYFGGESGMIDSQQERFVAGKIYEHYKYGSDLGNFDGLNYNYGKKLFGVGRQENDIDKINVEGSVKASRNFKSEEERSDTIFIPNGETAGLRDEIINDESDYSIRLDPHEYVLDSFSYLEVDDRNRLIHIIGEYEKMVVDFRKIHPKQQIVIYNFDKSGNIMEVQINGKTIYRIESGCFLRLYITNSLRVIAEKQQPSNFIW